MKKRSYQKTEVLVYKLILNPMTDRAESRSLVAVSTDYEKLVQWYSSQKATEPYRDGQWYKVFKQGSPLEWFNPVFSLELNNLALFGHGIADEWVDERIFEEVSRRGDPIYIK